MVKQGWWVGQSRCLCLQAPKASRPPRCGRALVPATAASTAAASGRARAASARSAPPTGPSLPREAYETAGRGALDPVLYCVLCCPFVSSAAKFMRCVACSWACSGCGARGSAADPLVRCGVARCGRCYHSRCLAPATGAASAAPCDAAGSGGEAAAPGAASAGRTQVPSIAGSKAACPVHACCGCGASGRGIRLLQCIRCPRAWCARCSSDQIWVQHILICRSLPQLTHIGCCIDLLLLPAGSRLGYVKNSKSIRLKWPSLLTSIAGASRQTYGCCRSALCAAVTTSCWGRHGMKIGQRSCKPTSTLQGKM